MSPLHLPSSLEVNTAPLSWALLPCPLHTPPALGSHMAPGAPWGSGLHSCEETLLGFGPSEGWQKLLHAEENGWFSIQVGQGKATGVYGGEEVGQKPSRPPISRLGKHGAIRSPWQWSCPPHVPRREVEGVPSLLQLGGVALWREGRPWTETIWLYPRVPVGL